MSTIVILDDNNFDNTIKSHDICVVQFYAQWCSPCMSIAPLFNKIADEMKNKYFFAKVDVDSSDYIVSKYNISNVPITLLFQSGILLDRLLGAYSYTQFVTFLNKNLK